MECFWSLFHSWQRRAEYFSLCCFNLGPPPSVYSNSIPHRWILQRHEYVSLCLVMTGQGWSENIPEIKGVWLSKVWNTQMKKSIFFFLTCWGRVKVTGYILHASVWSPWNDEVRAQIKSRFSASGLNRRPLMSGGRLYRTDVPLRSFAAWNSSQMSSGADV